MPTQRPRRFVIALVSVALVIGLALFQIIRHGLEANAQSRHVASGPPACAADAVRRDSSAATSPRGTPSPVTLRVDYAGPEAFINALTRDSLSDADVDSLFRIRGVCAVVDNISRFVPRFGAADFRRELREFARTKKPGKSDPWFRLNDVWRTRAEVLRLVAAIRNDERRFVDETLAQLEPYRPDVGSLSITAYVIVGGVSNGFAFESDPTSFYASLLDTKGDLNGIVSNMAHEAYHVMQFAAQERAGLNPRAMAADSAPPVLRLFATTLIEGTANYVVDPTRSAATGPGMDSARARYRRHAEPKHAAENFARFDDVLRKLRNGKQTWEKAYLEGFTSANDASFYFVGYEMAKAIEKYCGRACIARLFEAQPVEFFRQYIALYREHPDVTPRFSAETEAVIAAFPGKANP